MFISILTFSLSFDFVIRFVTPLIVTPFFCHPERSEGSNELVSLTARSDDKKRDDKKKWDEP
jgi:hypothetical protein